MATTAKKKAMTDGELVVELREFHHYESARRLDQLSRATVSGNNSVEHRAEDEAVRETIRETCMRASLVIGVYDAMIEATESFEDEVGADLAYLMGMILKGEKFEAWLGSNDDFLRLLVRAFDANNAVWACVDIMNDDANDVFPAHIKAAILGAAGSGGAVGNLDEENYPQAGAWVDVLKRGAS